MPQDTGIASRLRSRTRARASEPNILPSFPTEPAAGACSDHERENIPVAPSLKRKRSRAKNTKDVVKSEACVSNEASALQDRTNKTVVAAASGSRIAEAVALVAIANQKSSLGLLNDTTSISTSSPLVASPFKITYPYYTGPDGVRPPSPDRDPPSPQTPTQPVPDEHIVNTVLDNVNPTTPPVVANESNHVHPGAAPEPASVFVDSLDEFFPPTSEYLSESPAKSVRCSWDGCQETIEVSDVENMIQHLAVGHLFELFPPATRSSSSGEDDFPFPLFVECAWECDERDGGKDVGCCEIEIVVAEHGDVQAIARHVWDHHGMGKST